MSCRLSVTWHAGRMFSDTKCYTANNMNYTSCCFNRLVLIYIYTYIQDWVSQGHIQTLTCKFFVYIYKKKCILLPYPFYLRILASWFCFTVLIVNHVKKLASRCNSFIYNITEERSLTCHLSTYKQKKKSYQWNY